MFNKRLIICNWDRLRHVLKSKRLHWHSCISLHYWASGILRYHRMVVWLCLTGRLGTDNHSRMLSWDSGNDYLVLREKESIWNISQKLTCDFKSTLKSTYCRSATCSNTANDAASETRDCQEHQDYCHGNNDGEYFVVRVAVKFIWNKT